MSTVSPDLVQYLSSAKHKAILTFSMNCSSYLLIHSNHTFLFLNLGISKKANGSILSGFASQIYLQVCEKLLFRSCSYLPRNVVWMTHYCFVRAIMGERPSVRYASPSILAWELTDSQLYIRAV